MAPPGRLHYSADMTDSSAPDALARRYLDLWEEQMAAWASDGALADVLRLWLGLVGLDRFGAGSGGDGAPGRGGRDGEHAARAAPAAAASGDRDHDLAELARHLAEDGHGQSDAATVMDLNAVEGLLTQCRQLAELRKGWK